MGIVRVLLPPDRRGHVKDYGEIDQGMLARGYMLTIPGGLGDGQILYRLPVGTYWRAEPTDAHEMRADALAAASEADEHEARIVATAGITSWHNLPTLE